MELPHRLFTGVVVPPAVAREIAPTLPGPPPWIVVRRLSQPLHPEVARAALDPGESEALSLALELGAAGIVLDDLRARRRALGLGIHVVGTLGILLLAKRRGLIPSVRPDIAALAAARFYFAEEIAATILAAAGESDQLDPSDVA